MNHPAVAPFDRQPVAGSVESADAWHRAWQRFVQFDGDPFGDLVAQTGDDDGFALGDALCASYAVLGGAAPTDVAVRAGAGRARERAGGRERDEVFVVAMDSLLDGEFTLAAQTLDVWTATSPDFAATRLAHDIHLHIGDDLGRLRSAGAAVERWQPGEPGWSYVSAMYAFALGEVGLLDRSIRIAREALEVDPLDLWARHAIAHVHETRDERSESIRFLEDAEEVWTGQSALAVHLWWHLALRYLSIGHVRAVLEIADRTLDEIASPFRLTDLTSLLWRLELAGHDVGERWNEVGRRWDEVGAAHECGFLDVHAAMAMVRRDDVVPAAVQSWCRGVTERWAGVESENAEVFRRVVAPLVDAIAAFARREDGVALLHLAATNEEWHRIGGSNAQREILRLTRQAADERRSDGTATGAGPVGADGAPRLRRRANLQRPPVSIRRAGVPSMTSAARVVMERAGVDPTAISVFERQVEHVRGATEALIRDADIEPYDSPPLPDVGQGAGDDAVDGVAVIRLNGGLGTSMGMDFAKSLLPVRDGLSFLDIIALQTMDLRRSTGARLPLTFLHSFRTSADCLAALARHDGIEDAAAPIELMQNRVPRLLADSLEPVAWPADPELEWCPPGHGDLYTVLFASGLLDRLADQGFRHVFVANSDNLGARPDARVASWFAGTGAPFAIEAVRRTPSDRKGGHFARRNSDGRLILRETAQTPPDEVGAIERHRYASTNNLWFDVEAMRSVLAARRGDLHLPVIVNRKHVVPTDDDTPAVIQLETAMGAAVEVFEGATTVEVGRDRFIPVKTTDDLLVVRSDCYRLTEDHRLEQVSATIPFVALSGAYKRIDDFDRRFPAGAPSLGEATSLRVEGDWTFGADVTVVGDVVLGPEGGKVPDGTVLTGDGS